MSETPPPDRFEPGTSQYEDAQAVIGWLRERLQGLTGEYANGQINAAQFNALYRHYTEKRMVIERLIERDPDSDAWRAAARKGDTDRLRQRFEARVLYFAVFKRHQHTPLASKGKLPSAIAQRLLRVLRLVMQASNWRQGLMRKAMGGGYWLLLSAGEHSFTAVIYFMQPASSQVNALRDMHADFERANMLALQRDLPADRMVFPQRSLMQP